MLKKFCLSLALPLVSIFAAEIVDAPYEPHYAKGYPERHHWNNLRENFIKHRYKEILKRYSLELTCDGCSAVFLDVSLSVDALGQAHIHSVDRAKACGREFPPAMRGEFLAYLKAYTYPATLRGTSVKLRLGTGLSC